MNNALMQLMEKYKNGNRSVFNMGPFLSIELIWQKNLRFKDILQKSDAMTTTALLNFDLGFEATVLPYDLNVEAEILGAEVRYYDGYDEVPVYPTITEKWVHKAEDIVIPNKISETGRLPAIIRSIQTIKNMNSDRGAVGVFIPGPFTLAGQVMDMDEMFVMVLKKPDVTREILKRLAEFIKMLRTIYVEAGVDFIVVEEGGATTISPAVFRKLLLPYLKEILSEKVVPHALSLTGSSDKFIEMMLECKPDGIGVDQECDIDNVRKTVPEHIPLFTVGGDYTMLAQATPAEIEKTVSTYLNKGVTTVTPPADIYPPAKLENIAAFISTVRNYKGPVF